MTKKALLKTLVILLVATALYLAWNFTQLGCVLSDQGDFYGVRNERGSDKWHYLDTRPDSFEILDKLSTQAMTLLKQGHKASDLKLWIDHCDCEIRVAVRQPWGFHLAPEHDGNLFHYGESRMWQLVMLHPEKESEIQIWDDDMFPAGTELQPMHIVSFVSSERYQIASYEYKPAIPKETKGAHKP